MYSFVVWSIEWYSAGGWDKIRNTNTKFWGPPLSQGQNIWSDRPDAKKGLPILHNNPSGVLHSNELKQNSLRISRSAKLNWFLRVYLVDGNTTRLKLLILVLIAVNLLYSFLSCFFFSFWTREIDLRHPDWKKVYCGLMVAVWECAIQLCDIF